MVDATPVPVTPIAVPMDAVPGSHLIWIIALAVVVVLAVVLFVLLLRTRAKARAATPTAAPSFVPGGEAKGFCPRCGSLLAVGDLFCPGCGQKVR